MNRGIAKQHRVINKLLMGSSWQVVDGDTLKLVRVEGILNVTSQALSHQNKEEGGKGVTLPDTTRGGEGARGDPIHEDRETGRGDEAHDPSYLGVVESKSR